ncbi:unnamed protein product [Gadus morhua 'NCC']
MRMMMFRTRSSSDSVLRYVTGADRLARKLRLLRKLSSASSQRLKELRLTFRLQEEDYPDLLDQIALSPPAPPPRRELPDVATSAPGGLEEQLRHFGDIEENELVIHPPRLHPEHPDL